MSVTREQFNELKTLKLFKSKVVTNSMEPVIMVGKEIVIDIGNRDIKQFDIIVIYMNERLVCHYLWRKNKLVEPILLQTRSLLGQLDVPVRWEDYLGKVITHKLSWWQKFCILVLKKTKF